MVSEGVPLLDVKEILGHSTIKMTEKYAHLTPHHARDAVGQLNKWPTNDDPKGNVPEPWAHSGHSERPVHSIEEMLGRKRRA